MEQHDQASTSSSSGSGNNRDAEAETETEAEALSSGIRESETGAASASSPFDARREGVGEEGDDGRGGRLIYDFRHPEIIAEESQQEQQQEQQQQHNFFGIPYRRNIFFYDDSSVVREDTWSCVIVVLTFWFFVSMTLILGVYGTDSISLGPYSSILIEPNPIFVQSIQVEGLDDTVSSGLVLYGLYDSPSLDVAKTWSISHNASVPYDSHKEWIYFLNEGSQINITYNLSSTDSLFLIIAEGSEGLAQWLEDPTYPNTTLSWNVIHGSGTVQQHIYTSTSYYVAVGNLNSDDIEVNLDLSVRSFLYNTTEAYYKCSLADGACDLSILFPTGNSVVLTSPGSEEASSDDEWDVKVSYGPRWATYIVGVATMTVLMLGAFNFLNKLRCYREEESGVNYRVAESERAPLLQYKDDDLSSWGSSYDSASSDEKDLEEFLAANGIEGKPAKDGENGNNTRRLCAICYDAPRDCFFLPCGHCVACFECGTRIAEAAGICPVCRRDMKKVRKIFTV